MSKKFHYKAPAIIALTIAGTAITTHQAFADSSTGTNTNTDSNRTADQTQQPTNQTKDTQVQTNNSNTKVAGTQTYKDPAQVQPVNNNQNLNYDSKLEDLNSKADNSNVTATGQTSNEQQSNVSNTPESSADNSTNTTQQSDQSAENTVQNPTNQTKVENNQSQQNVVQSQSDSNQLDNSNNQQNAVEQNKNQIGNTASVNAEQQKPEQTNNDAQQSVQTNTANTESKAAPKLAMRSFAAQPTTNTTQKQAVQPAAQTAKTTTATAQKQTVQPAAQTAKAPAATAQKQTVQPAAQTAKTTAATTQKQAVQPTAKTATTTANRSVAPATTAAKTTATSSLPKYKPAVNSSINDYIRKNNYKAPTYEQDFSSYLPKYDYRYGKPEGIVVHDTANDNSNINGEISYMKNNWQNAFVHGFIDGNRIVETANTDYLAWGAGPVANQRFIHIELVHEHSYDGFARQMNNYADYAATNLQYYGLKPDSAEYDGQGTVWTHYAISKYLGGTDHSDPHGYLQAHNYSYDQLYDLINEKYLIKQGQVAPWGTTASTPSTPSKNTSNTPKPSTTPTNSQLKVIPVDSIGRVAANNHGVYTSVYDKAGVQKPSVNDRTYRLTKKALLGDKSFYLITDYNKNTNVGWVQTSDINYRVGKPVTTNTTTYSVQPGTKLYHTPWGSERQSIGSVTGTGSQQFKAQKQTEVGTSTYVYGAVNGKNAWVDSAKLSKYTAPKTAVKSVAAPKTQVKAATTTTPSKSNKTTAAKPATNTKTTAKTAAKPTTNTKATAKTAAKPVAKTNTATKTAAKPVAKTNTATKTTAKPNVVTKAATAVKKAVQPTAKAATTAKPAAKTATNAAVKPAAKTTTATKGKSTSPLNQTVVVNKLGQYVSNQYGLRASVYDAKGANAAKYLGYTYDILRERNQDGTLYYLLQNNGLSTPLGWVNAKDVKVVNQSNATPVSTKYNVKQGNNGLYTMPWGTSKQQIDTLKQTNSAFQASKRKLVNGAAYVYGTVNGKTGWIAEKDLVQSNAKAATTPVKAQPATAYKHDYIVANAGSNYYNTPNGKILGSLRNQYGNIISVYEKQLVNGVTWYHGTLANGKTIWIKAADVRDTLTRTTTSNYSLNQAANIQSSSPWPPQVQHTPGKWVNATKDEVKTAMDPKTITEDATQKYQFLRLDKAQNLSTSSVNQLLKGKGILEGQGAAFAQAAQKYDINEIYLISHALLETGNGTSALANGGYVDNNNKVVTNSNKKYYNMFGIGAIDTDAVRGGFKTAQNYGWDTVSKAIVGGAQFIKDAYINQGQNTLYRMRWNPSAPGNHQYATDINWASHNATRMKTMYDSIGESGKYFDVDNYKG
ncbi:peptidoglycan hydrolase [Staphylococcus condimenti]|uniref:Bifunctional autolysin n=2 Tax=Staphylococcus condimenti TaxID=70255 RepID=A0AB37H3D0_9STAP|nr:MULTISPECIES: glucosaminidase domain-containing protein [Staphylococcus]AMY05262.1 peptidoglycan hydrolase [Staphylococcus condimenti]APR61468.1 peptidoglycan hydrolase [Staphylococcus condimenti]OFO98724.1 peptidoglycan hydrolase [Staphylococcus sp. HMSC065E08]PNZ59751.1 peptidoglycan hydrolase [Staphylococcus condimenti]QQS82930.1 glucosaminidase domain-containing protein [Staphylococcus condimenti]